MLENRKDSIGMIYESLQRNKSKSILESVEYDEKLVKRVNRNFGKITKVKEVWGELTDEDLEKISTKFIKVSTNINDIDVDVVLDALQKKTFLSVNTMLRILFKVTKIKFSVYQASNLRIVFNNYKKPIELLEVIYDKRIKKDSEDDISISQSVEVPSDATFSQSSLNVSKAAAKAEEYKLRDANDISKNVTKVLDLLSTEAKPVTKEKIKLESIQSEGGCDLDTAKKAAKVSDDLFESSAKEEPIITKDIIKVVKDNNGSMYGLDFRLKQGTSLGRKIVTDAMDPANKFVGDLKKAAENVKDSIRYTAIFDMDDFTTGYFNVKKSLESKGYKEFRCKNFYISYREGNSQQKAVQCVFESPKGLKFELQFHTPESQGAKEVNHPLYEKFRDASTSLEDLRVLDMRMVNISSNVPDPVGVFTIENH